VVLNLVPNLLQIECSWNLEEVSKNTTIIWGHVFNKLWSYEGQGSIVKMTPNNLK
jgi:hypothetical protein